MPPPVSAPFFVIAGATACGKSALAVRVAECCGGEIVGADAFQIYTGLELLTAQPDADLRLRIPHYLVGEIAPTQRFDVAQYAALARARIEDIHARGRVPIVCGGTGLYLRALLHGLAELPGADATLRAELEVQPAGDLVRQLTELDPETAGSIDLRNPRRVVRALEVRLLTGRSFCSFRQAAPQVAKPRGIVLQRDRAELHARIAARSAAMLAGGVGEEVRRLRAVGETAGLAIGLREVRQLLADEITRAECLQRITIATRQYAKRQETWFRREPALRPVAYSDHHSEALVHGLACEAAGAQKS